MNRSLDSRAALYLVWGSLATINPSLKTTAQEKPMQSVKNIVLVHGARADSSSWSKLIPPLKAKGF